MYQEKIKYLEFMLRTKGSTKKYIETTSIHIEKAIRFLEELGAREARQVTRQHLDKFQDHIIKQEYTNATKRSIILAVALFFKHLFDYGVIKENPGLILEPPRQERSVPKTIMNKEELRFLFNLPDRKDLFGVRDLCIMSLLYSTAMRPSELFNLDVYDVDFVHNQALIRKSKNKRERIVCFDRYTAFFLKKYLEKVRPQLLKKVTSNKLFISTQMDALKSTSWAVSFKRNYRPAMEAKFHKSITPYSFRHTSATHWLDSAARQKKDVLPFIQRQLGHESLESTVVYTHVAIEPLRQMFKMYHPRERSRKAYLKSQN